MRTWQVAYRGQVPAGFLDALATDQREAGWRQVLAGSDLPSTGAFVIEDDAHRVIGFVHISPSRDADAAAATGEVTSVYLLPEYWGQGFGRALMDRALDSLRDAGFSAATLWVLDSNLDARSFYEATGWATDGGTKVDDRAELSLHELRYRHTL